MIHRKENVPEGGTWGLIGGGIENNNVLGSFLQKVEQEVGLKLKGNQVKEVKVFDWDNPNVKFHLYRLMVEKNPEINLNTDGHSEYKWLNPKELYEKYPLMKGLYKIIKEIYF